MPADHVAVVSRAGPVLTEVRRLCAMAGHAVLVVGPGAEAARVSRSAAFVIVDDAAIAEVGADELAQVLGSGRVDVVVTDDPGRVATWEAAVRLGARRVVSLPAGAAELLDLLALAGEREGPPGPLFAVVAGRGGAGASTMAVALGWALSRQGAVATLVDLDPTGGGLDVALGLERADGLRWPDLRGVRGVVAAAALREQLPSAGGLAVVSAGRVEGPGGQPARGPDRAAAAAVIGAARRGGGAVVADVPRWLGDVPEAVVADCDAVVLVVPADVRAVMAATAVAGHLRALCEDVRLVVRVEPKSRLRVGDVVTALGLEHAGTLRTEAGVTSAVDRAELLRWLARSRLGREASTLARRLRPSTAEGRAS